MEVGLPGLIRDIQVVPDVFLVIIDETVAVPMPLHVVVETEPQDDVRWVSARVTLGYRAVVGRRLVKYYASSVPPLEGPESLEGDRLGSRNCGQTSPTRVL